jgi:peptidyl-prolyl cis-trans isomerase A (cyclophilin A)
MAETTATKFPDIDVPGTGELRARMKTSLGVVVLRLFEKDVPNTVKNFVGLATGKIEWTDPKSGQKAKRPFYDKLAFHRCIPDFMIQGGCPLGQGTGSPGYRFADEFSPKARHSKAGILSMANAGPNTNGGQFFITLAPTPHLDDHHSVFGEVAQGLDVVMKIGKVKTVQDRPATPIVIQSIKIERVPAA